MYQCDNGNDMFDSFINICEKIDENHAPIQSVKKGGEIYQNSKPWLTQELKHLIAQRQFLFNKWKKIPDSETYREFKRLRNLVNRRLREAHNNFCINFFQKLPTSKEQWTFFKQKTSPSERIVKVDEIRLVSGEISREPKNIVNCLNRAFANLGVFKGSDTACKYTDKLNIPEFTFRTVTRKELYSVIDSLDNNKAAEPGEISIRLKVLQISYRRRSTVRLKCLKECIKEKVFPTKTKLAYVTLIFKKGDKLDSTNYRPISVTPSFAKVFERHPLPQMMEFIDKHKIINKEQFGFQKKSPTDAVLVLVEIVSANLDQSKETVAIFLNLAKAFNSISHNIFLKKLKCMLFPRKRKNYCFHFLPTADKK